MHPRARWSSALLLALGAGALAACGQAFGPSPVVSGLQASATLEAEAKRQGITAQELQAKDEPNWMGPNEDLGHFFQVDSGLFRGQQPTDAGLQQLKQRGMKTVVYLHFDKKQAAHEKQIVEGLGMRFVHIPMSYIVPPPKSQVDTWLNTTLSEASRPVFVHCQHGRDRTGTMVGIYRIAHDGWNFKSAYTEMKEKGFRTFFVGLTWGVKRFANQHGGQEKPTAEELPFLSAP